MRIRPTLALAAIVACWGVEARLNAHRKVRSSPSRSQGMGSGGGSGLPLLMMPILSPWESAGQPTRKRACGRRTPATRRPSRRAPASGLYVIASTRSRTDSRERGVRSLPLSVTRCWGLGTCCASGPGANLAAGQVDSSPMEQGSLSQIEVRRQ